MQIKLILSVEWRTTLYSYLEQTSLMLIWLISPSVKWSCASKDDNSNWRLQLRGATSATVAQFSVSVTSRAEHLSVNDGVTSQLHALTFRWGASLWHNPAVFFLLLCRFIWDRVTPHSILAAEKKRKQKSFSFSLVVHILHGWLIKSSAILMITAREVIYSI